LENIKDFATGYYHSLALTNDGFVYCFGRNLVFIDFFNQKYLNCGDTDSNDKTSPYLIPNLSNVIKVYAGLLNSCVQKDTGFYTFGSASVCFY
jgi:hypothetical protein